MCLCACSLKSEAESKDDFLSWSIVIACVSVHNDVCMIVTVCVCACVDISVCVCVCV